MISYHPKSSTKKIAKTFTSGFFVMPWLNPEQVARCISSYAWSPILWANGYRSTKNFRVSYWIGLDFDCSELTLENAVNNVFCDMIHVIGTTRNHQVSKDGITGDRFRVVLKWTAPVNCPKTYQYNLEKLIKRFDADPACSDPARHFFPCREIVSVCEEGYTQDVEPLERSYLDHLALREKRRVKTRCGVLSRYAQQMLSTTWKEGTKNTTCFALGCELARCGVSYEDAIARILESPEYAHRRVEQTLYDEIAEAVFNGFKAEGVTCGRWKDYKPGEYSQSK